MGLVEIEPGIQGFFSSWRYTMRRVAKTEMQSASRCLGRVLHECCRNRSSWGDRVLILVVKPRVEEGA